MQLGLAFENFDFCHAALCSRLQGLQAMAFEDLNHDATCHVCPIAFTFAKVVGNAGMLSGDVSVSCNRQDNTCVYLYCQRSARIKSCDAVL